MDAEKIEKLIEIVRGHIFLYDLGHAQYKNASLKSTIWDSIGRELNESGEAVRNKWKTIRDGYTKYKKQIKGSTGSSRKNVSYTWASQLAFLDNVNVPRASSSNVSLDVTQPSPRTETPLLDSDQTQNITSQPYPSQLPSTSSSPQITPSTQVQSPNSPANPSTAPTTVSHRNNKRSAESRRDDDDVGRVIQFLNEKKKKEYDGIDHLFLSYAETFKKFPLREQAIVKMELAKFFSNMELKLLNNNSTNSDFQYTSVISPSYSTISSISSFEVPPLNLCADNLAVEPNNGSINIEEETLPQIDDYFISPI